MKGIATILLALLVVHVAPLAIHIDIEADNEGHNSTVLADPAIKHIIDSPAEMSLEDIEDQIFQGIEGYEDQQPITSQKVTGLDGGRVCHKEKLSQNTLEKAVEKGLDAIYKGKICTKGDPCFPHVFKNYDSMPFKECVKDAAKTYEFPVMRGEVFNGGPPGMDRVIFVWKSDQKALFCGVITHAGAAKKNDFTVCQRGL